MKRRAPARFEHGDHPKRKFCRSLLSQRRHRACQRVSSTTSVRQFIGMVKYEVEGTPGVWMRALTQGRVQRRYGCTAHAENGKSVCAQRETIAAHPRRARHQRL